MLAELWFGMQKQGGFKWRNPMKVKKKAAVALLAGLAVTLGLFAIPGSLTAAPAGNDDAKPTITIPKLELTETKLDNGLRVILVPDPSAPVYSIDVCYNVGSRNERPGRTGFAHLFEHMMFQGSENVGKGEHFIQVLNNGGGMNGTTNEDRTTYFEELPINQLDLGLFLKPTACVRLTLRKRISITNATPSRKNAAKESTTSPTDAPTSTWTTCRTTTSPTSTPRSDR